MYSYTSATPRAAEGTYFRIENGKMFGLDGHFVRNTTRNDHVDVVQRVLKLSNDTGRFCKKVAGVERPTDWSTVKPAPREPPPCAAIGTCTLPNPVEVCTAIPEDCFSDANIEKTCMDLTQNIIFIRSRLENTTGNRWITRTDLH